MIQYFTRGPTGLKDKLNQLVDEVNKFSRLVGDGIIQVQRSSTGTTISINKNQLGALIPKVGGLSSEGLKARYPFSGHANDISGNERDGTLQGNATAALDILELDGTGDYVTTASDFIGTGAICVTFWFRSTVGLGTIISNGKFVIKIIAGAGIIQVLSDGSTTTSSSAASFDDTDWTHCAINRYADGTVDIYFDSVIDKDGAAGSTPVAGTTNFTIGASAAGALAYRGALDDIRIYGKTLTSDQINKIYTEGHTQYVFHARQVFGACTLFEVQSAGSGDGIYNCFEQKLDATDWADTGGVTKIVAKDAVSIEVLNLAEFDPEPEYIAHLAAGDLLLAFRYGDDESNRRWIGKPFRQGAHGAGVRLAYCSEAAPADNTIGATLDHTTGTAITVTCHICGGAALNEAVPRLADNDEIFVVKIGGTWYCTTTFQTSEDCDCVT